LSTLRAAVRRFTDGAAGFSGVIARAETDSRRKPNATRVFLSMIAIRRAASQIALIRLAFSFWNALGHHWPRATRSFQASWASHCSSAWAQISFRISFCSGESSFMA